MGIMNQISFIERYLPTYLNGAITTIELSIIGVILG